MEGGLVSGNTVAANLGALNRRIVMPNHSLNRTARRRRWCAVRSRPVSLVR